MKNKEIDKNTKPIIFTGITSTGTLTIGHYMGVIQHLINFQEDYQVIVMIADLHALTTVLDKKIDYQNKTKEIASLLYSCGLREENCKVFVQSQIKEHLELSYFLSSYCSVGKLNNMIQYKEKSKDNQNSNVSLLSYPILMAGDILLYDADLIIVGEDQKQHLELTKYIANKFNANNNNCLKIPNFYSSELGSKIMGLKNPMKKMSKSSNDNISLLDSKQSVKEKIIRAETDSEGKIYYSEDKAGISNLLVILSCLTNKKIDELELDFSNSNYSIFKKNVVENINLKLEKIQEKFIFYNKRIDLLLEKNNKEIRELANEKISKIRKEIGLWIFSEVDED